MTTKLKQVMKIPKYKKKKKPNCKRIANWEM